MGACFSAYYPVWALDSFGDFLARGCVESNTRSFKSLPDKSSVSCLLCIYCRAVDAASSGGDRCTAIFQPFKEYLRKILVRSAIVPFSFNLIHPYAVGLSLSLAGFLKVLAVEMIKSKISFCCFLRILATLGQDFSNQKIKHMNYYEQLKQLVHGIEDDFIKFYEKENNAAGTRIRKGMQDLKVLAQEIRTHVQDLKNKSSKQG